MQHFRRCKNGAAVQKRCSTSSGAKTVQHFKRCKSGAALQAVQKRCSSAALQAVQKRCSTSSGAKCKRCKAVQGAAFQAVQHFKRCKNGAALQAVQEVLRFFQCRRCRGCKVEFYFWRETSSDMSKTKKKRCIKRADILKLHFF